MALEQRGEVTAELRSHIPQYLCGVLIGILFVAENVDEWGGLMTASRAYPLRYGGGLFLCCVGTGLVLAVLTDFARANFYFGLGGLIGTLGYVVAWRRSVAWHGKPRLYQYLVIFAAIALQVSALSLLAKAPWFQALADDHRQLVVLAVVALHFMPMYWAFGRWVVWLGAANLVWTAEAAAAAVPIPVVILVFGSLNVLFGAIMAVRLLGRPPQQTP